MGVSKTVWEIWIVPIGRLVPTKNTALVDFMGSLPLVTKTDGTHNFPRIPPFHSVVREGSEHTGIVYDV